MSPHQEKPRKETPVISVLRLWLDCMAVIVDSQCCRRAVCSACSLPASGYVNNVHDRDLPETTYTPIDDVRRSCKKVSKAAKRRNGYVPLCEPSGKGLVPLCQPELFTMRADGSILTEVPFSNWNRNISVLSVSKTNGNAAPLTAIEL